MAHEYKVTRRVEFSETDMAGIVHYANFFRFMETAEQAFYRSLGFSVVMDQLDPPLGWPRVHAECDYRKPLHFDDLVEIHLLVKQKKSKAITYLFRFRRLEPDPVEEVAQGALTIVCVAYGEGGKMVAVTIPALVADKIQVAPPELLV